MTTGTIPHPPIASRDQWLAERRKLLAHEKELTRHGDRVTAEAPAAAHGEDRKGLRLRRLNFRTPAELEAKVGPKGTTGEEHGFSVFFRLGDDIFHTYSSYERGNESVTDSYQLLDLTPYGRQEDFEDSPPGWPQKPTYG